MASTITWNVKPTIPLFSGVTPNKVARRDPLSEAITTAATAVVGLLKGSPDVNSATRQASGCSAATSDMSPAKPAHVSGAYLDHLDKLKRLFEAGPKMSLRNRRVLL